VSSVVVSRGQSRSLPLVIIRGYSILDVLPVFCTCIFYAAQLNVFEEKVPFLSISVFFILFFFTFSYELLYRKCSGVLRSVLRRSEGVRW
jgi:hypothetical protein